MQAAPCGLGVGLSPSSKPARAGGPLALGIVVAISAALLLSACGSDKSTGGTAPSTSTSSLHNAVAAPPSTELTPGASIRVSSKRLHSVGWQVSCTGEGKRVNAEAVRGQQTATGLIAGFRGGTPSIWVAHNQDGSIIVSCR
jgi:hypothetical protein